MAGYYRGNGKTGVKALEEETTREMIDKLTKDEGNGVCADCGEISKKQQFNSNN